MGIGVDGKCRINSDLVTCEHLWHKGNKYLNTDVGKQIIKMGLWVSRGLDSSINVDFHCGLARIENKKPNYPLDYMHL